MDWSTILIKLIIMTVGWIIVNGVTGINPFSKKGVLLIVGVSIVMAGGMYGS